MRTKTRLVFGIPWKILGRLHVCETNFITGVSTTLFHVEIIILIGRKDRELLARGTFSAWNEFVSG